MKQTAKALREQDPKKYTQRRVAEILGVGQQRVSDWLGAQTTGTGNTRPPPDARVKVPVEARPKLVERLETETVRQVAATGSVRSNSRHTLDEQSLN